MKKKTADMRKKLRKILKSLPKTNRRTRQINASFESREYQLISQQAKRAKRRPAEQLKLMALAFAAQNRLLMADFAPLAQDLRALRALAEEYQRQAGGMQRLGTAKLRDLAERLDQWERQLERFLKLT